MRQTDPIGVLDSGIGGLSIWREITRILPQESTIYIGDHAFAPYGNLSEKTIQDRVKQLIRFLLKKNAKIIVVACNTATVAGIDKFRRWFDGIPIIGVVPVIKTAVSMTKTKHVAVLSTPNTASSVYQQSLIMSFAGGCAVENIGVPDLVSHIETGATDVQVERYLRHFLDTINTKGVDVIALGCTHFPFIAHIIRKIMGKQVSIIDSSGAVARHTSRVLDANGLRANNGKPYTIFYTTANPERVSRVATKCIGRPVAFIYEQL